MTTVLPDGAHSVRVEWPAPQFEDNSGSVRVRLFRGKPSNSTFPEGSHNIVYHAFDTDGNYELCIFRVSVKGKMSTVVTIMSAFDSAVGIYHIHTNHVSTAFWL